VVEALAGRDDPVDLPVEPERACGGRPFGPPEARLEARLLPDRPEAGFAEETRLGAGRSSDGFFPDDFGLEGLGEFAMGSAGFEF
jgi:hypothetical protein